MAISWTSFCHRRTWSTSSLTTRSRARCRVRAPTRTWCRRSCWSTTRPRRAQFMYTATGATVLRLPTCCRSSCRWGDSTCWATCHDKMSRCSWTALRTRRSSSRSSPGCKRRGCSSETRRQRAARSSVRMGGRLVAALTLELVRTRAASSTPARRSPQCERKPSLTVNSSV